MKPKTPDAMCLLIEQVRTALPFSASEQYLCRGECRGCSLKLLEFLDTELTDWERRLRNGEVPGLGDVQRIAKTSKKVYQVLVKNGVI